MNRIRVGLAGCGSVSEHYLANLKECPHVEVVAVCDIVESRYRERMAEFGVGKGFPSLGEMLEGAEFDLLLNTTSMPAHYPLNKQALLAGKHVYGEKPFADTYEHGRELLELARSKGLRLWGAPNVVTSPQFRFMAETLAAGKIGKVQAAHACYGHSGPSWGPWFYKEGGGSLNDLGVYNVTTLTGLLGPAKSVTALMGTAVAQREIENETVEVRADDNTMLLLDHGDAVFSHIQCGFVYRSANEDRTIELIGLRGAMNLLGWDWGPKGVQIRLECEMDWQTRCTATQGYNWQGGLAYAAGCMVEDTPCLMTPEHALHVVEIMEGARISAETGRRVELKSAFAWPIIGHGQ